MAKRKAKASGEGEWSRRGGLVPFWSPWRKRKGQKADPTEIVGQVTGVREMEGKWAREGRDGKPTKVRKIVEVQDMDGCMWSLDTGTAALAPLADDYDAGSLVVGETQVRVVYKGDRKVRGRGKAMHDVEVYTR